MLTINGYAYTQAFATKAFVDPLNCSNVYAGAYGIGVYASHDGGATPVALYSLPLGMPPSGFVFDPDTAGTVYAASPASNLYMQLYGSSGYGYSYPIAVPVLSSERQTREPRGRPLLMARVWIQSPWTKNSLPRCISEWPLPRMAS